MASRRPIVGWTAATGRRAVNDGKPRLVERRGHCNKGERRLVTAVGACGYRTRSAAAG
ncbi:hypothetical protein CASFOL_003392 [Castilleja foliolosa]|uniref:Uncharacterized protein n=1 Tax=Castilleja foliolosa TaxID=1961234 RepID=A0ABD3EKD8_9LAMI